MPTKIEWTDETWNPVTGCTKVSLGCKNCYAERIANNFRRQGGSDKYRRGFQVTAHKSELEEPLKWKKPRRVFVCSMGDLFHEEIAPSFISEVFSVMRRAHAHTFVVLTKRAERMSKWGEKWPENVWVGVSVEAERYLFRIDHLRNVQTRVRLVSFEPLIGEIREPNLDGIHWVIVGGERTARQPRKMEVEWVRHLRDECVRQDVHFFFKQWGDAYGFFGSQDRQVDGRYHEASPVAIGDQYTLF